MFSKDLQISILSSVKELKIGLCLTGLPDKSKHLSKWYNNTLQCINSNTHTKHHFHQYQYLAHIIFCKHYTIPQWYIRRKQLSAIYVSCNIWSALLQYCIFRYSKQRVHQLRLTRVFELSSYILVWSQKLKRPSAQFYAAMPMSFHRLTNVRGTHIPTYTPSRWRIIYHFIMTS